VHRAVCPVLVIVYLFVPCRPALADGGMFPVFAGSAASSDQRAVLAFDGGRETLILQTAYEGDGTDFAWVIPVPVEVGQGDVGTADPRIFDDLYELTEPRAYQGSGGGGLLGCGSSGGGALRSVQIWHTFQVDGYDVAVLSAGESSDLADWLDQNGYAFPVGQQAALDYYVSKSWFFVAAKLSPAGSGGGDEARPLRLSFDAPEPVFPMRISSATSSGEVEVLLYVIARHRVTSSNYDTEAVQLTALYRGGDFGAYYDQQFRQSLAEAGAGSLLVEYAGILPSYMASTHAADLGLGSGGYYVTRFRSYLQPHHMTEDIVLAEAPNDDPFEVRVASAAPADARVRLVRLGMILVIGTMLGVVVRGRDGLMRGLLAAGLVALALL
jgi:hypothetical protein